MEPGGPDQEYSAASIAIAIYMGFTDLYLVGYDYTHQPSRNRHWYEYGVGEYGNHQGFQREFFNMARQYVNITTITLDGESELLPSIRYEVFTGTSPLFHENDEIVDSNDLRVLATRPTYNIFQL